jgi:aspartate racemase
MLNSPEKILGVLGGMGPAATAEFLRLLAVHAPAERDQEHPRVVLLSNPRVPDRTAAIRGAGEDLTHRLQEDLLRLVDWGADLLAVPCNTAHPFINDFREELPVPLVHIVEVTLAEAKRRIPGGGWLVATSGTVESRIYQNEAHKHGYPLHVPGDDTQAAIHKTTLLVKANHTQEAARQLRVALQRLRGEKNLPIVAACTEIPLAYTSADLPPGEMVSSLEALALSCLRELYAQVHEAPGNHLTLPDEPRVQILPKG